MTRKTLMALAAVLALVAGACREEGGGGGGGATGGGDLVADCPSDYDATAGITDTEIRLASSIPSTGPLGVLNLLAGGMRSYFNWYNETQGGFEGRKIALEIEDDAYEPNRTQENVSEFLGGEQPFAFLAMTGTPNNLFVWDELNEECVPHLFLTTGAAEWGADIDSHPWTVGLLPAYQLEMAIFFEYLARAQPDAKTVAVLYQNDDFGESYLNGVKSAIEGTEFEVVAEESHERGESIIDTQVTNLAESDADVFIGGITGDVCPNAIRAIGESEWDPLVYMNQTCTASIYLDPAGPEGAPPEQRYANGVYSTAYLQNPADPQFAENPGMQTYLENVEQFAPEGANAPKSVAIVALGWQVGELFVRALEEADELTRPALMEAVRRLDVEGSLLLDDVRFVTSGTDDGYPLETLYIAQYNGELFEILEPFDYEGRTDELVDKDELSLE